MKSSKGKDSVAGGSGMPTSRPDPRVGNGLRRAVPAAAKTAARPAAPVASVADGRAKERLRLRLNDLLAAEFAAFAKLSPMRKRLAARLGESPEEIGRFLSGPAAPAADTVQDVVAAPAAAEAAPPAAEAAPPAAKQARHVARAGNAAAPSRKAAAAAAPPAAPPGGRGSPAFLTAGTTIAIGAMMVGPGIAALASVDVNPVAQVETI